MKVLLSITLLALLLGSCQGSVESDQDRTQRLGDQLRCPVCRGVPISESPAELAKEMMQMLREQMKQGKSDEEILAFFETRYGEWVLLAPKAEGMNLVVWILPLAVMIAGAVFIVLKIKKEGS